MSKPTLSDLSPRYQEQVRAQLRGIGRPVTAHPAAILAPARPVKPRLRQKQGDGMNKTERAFKAWLEAVYSLRKVLPHAITLKLANGVRYTPDFLVVAQHTSGEASIDAYEVKGMMRDDAVVKLKVAAAVYPWITFNLVTRAGAAWRIEEVRP